MLGLTVILCVFISLSHGNLGVVCLVGSFSLWLVSFSFF